MKKVLLNSGGMDSFLLAAHPAYAEADHVFVDIDQEYRDKEFASAVNIAENFGATLHCESGASIAKFGHASGIIPYRNAELILCAAQHGDTIGLGVLADEVNSDKSPQFFRAMEAVLNISHSKQYWTDGKEHRIETPLAGNSKAQHIYNYLKSGGDIEVLLRTVSCYDGGDQHCGKCASCFKRWIALTVATGNPEIQPYNVAPWLAYDIDYLMSRMPTYNDLRQGETRLAFSLVGIAL